MIIEAQRVAADYINSDGEGIKGRGLLKIEKIDTGCDPRKAVDAANQLINRVNPELLIGPTCSSSAIQGAKEVSIPKNMLLISPSASSPEISLMDDKDLVFRTIPSDTQQAYTLAEYLLSINVNEVLDGEALLNFGSNNLNSNKIELNLSLSADLKEAARNFFDYLHRLDNIKYKGIAVAPIPLTGLGKTINDRLTRAIAK